MCLSGFLKLFVTTMDQHSPFAHLGLPFQFSSLSFTSPRSVPVNVCIIKPLLLASLRCLTELTSSCLIMPMSVCVVCSSVFLFTLCSTSQNALCTICHLFFTNLHLFFFFHAQCNNLPCISVCSGSACLLSVLVCQSCLRVEALLAASPTHSLSPVLSFSFSLSPPLHLICFVYTQEHSLDLLFAFCSSKDEAASTLKDIYGNPPWLTLPFSFFHQSFSSDDKT